MAGARRTLRTSTGDCNNGADIWSEICKKGGAEDILRNRHGLLGSTLLRTVRDVEDHTECSAACAVRSPLSDTLVFTTLGFEHLVGCGRTYDRPVLGRTFRDCLQPDNPAVDRLINSKKWAELSVFAEKAEIGTDIVMLMLSQTGEGNLFWNFVHGFPIVTQSFGCFVVLVVTVLEVSVHSLICKLPRDGKAAFDIAVLEHMVGGLHEDVRDKVDNGKSETVSVLSQRAERACTVFVEQLEASFEGEHFVPIVGKESVEAFNKMNAWEGACGEIEAELKAAWEADDEIYRNTEDALAKSIACSVADPSNVDCPLVYISPGFEVLTQYRRTFALGRNCRFLQPNNRMRNNAFNGDETHRMKIFCTKQCSGQILNFLLQETADGTHFWNLLFMQHLHFSDKYSSGQKRDRHYIFGVQSSIVLQKDIVDRLILDVWESGRGKMNLALLRKAFHEAESSFEPKEISPVKLSCEVISAWVLEAGQFESSFWERGHYVPLVGHPAVKEFAGGWPILMEHAAAGIREVFIFSDAIITSMRENSDSEGAIVCAVSDPSALDCPLVFISKGFENITGYRNEFALGRNCRFLQPSSSELNKRINGVELDRMRTFCGEHAIEGNSLVNLLLNERKSGERFWNLLYMKHVRVRGKPYILAVHTVLDLPLPLLLRDNTTSNGMMDYDSSVLMTFTDELAGFTGKVRETLQLENAVNMAEMSRHATTSLLQYMKRNCDDFEGDHMVVRTGQDEALSFELDSKWKQVLSRVKNQLVAIWDVSDYNDEQVACAVSDPNAQDCPLVYVSQRFELMTGYPRDWVLGRNCRFLQPNDSRRNTHFNGSEKKKMSAFCTQPQPAGTRIVNLLVNEHKDGHPFWNLLVMEHVDVDGYDYIFGVQMGIDIEAGKLTEILAGDRDGVSELERLRKILMAREEFLGQEQQSLRTILDDTLREWTMDFPAHLEMLRFKVNGPRKWTSDVDLPWAAVALRPQENWGKKFCVLMDNGIRHFAIALTKINDATVQQVGKLVSLQVAQLLFFMRTMNLHYMRACVVFSLITRPSYVSSFQSIMGALSSSGYRFHSWLLDIRSYGGDKPLPATVATRLKNCFQIMSEAQEMGNVKSIGLYGDLSAIMMVMECLKKHRKQHPIGILVTDDSPAAEINPHLNFKFRKLYVEDYRSPLMGTYNLYGENDSLLDNTLMQDQARALYMDVPTLLLKWAAGKGLLTFIPHIDDMATEGVTKGAFSNSHRTFMRNFAAGPDANHVASVLDQLKKDNAVDLNDSFSKRRGQDFSRGTFHRRGSSSISSMGRHTDCCGDLSTTRRTEAKQMSDCFVVHQKPDVLTVSAPASPQNRSGRGGGRIRRGRTDSVLRSKTLADTSIQCTDAGVGPTQSPVRRRMSADKYLSSPLPDGYTDACLSPNSSPKRRMKAVHMLPASVNPTRDGCWSQAALTPDACGTLSNVSRGLDSQRPQCATIRLDVAREQSTRRTTEITTSPRTTSRESSEPGLDGVLEESENDEQRSASGHEGLPASHALLKLQANPKSDGQNGEDLTLPMLESPSMFSIQAWDSMRSGDEASQEYVLRYTPPATQSTLDSIDGVSLDGELLPKRRAHDRESTLDSISSKVEVSQDGELLPKSRRHDRHSTLESIRSTDEVSQDQTSPSIDLLVETCAQDSTLNLAKAPSSEALVSELPQQSRGKRLSRPVALNLAQCKAFYSSEPLRPIKPPSYPKPLGLVQRPVASSEQKAQTQLVQNPQGGSVEQTPLAQRVQNLQDTPEQLNFLSESTRSSDRSCTEADLDMSPVEPSNAQATLPNPSDDKTQIIAEKLFTKGWDMRDVAELLECDEAHLANIWRGEKSARQIIGG